MKKYILSGALGVTIGAIVSIIMSAIFGQGVYLPINPFSVAGAYYQAHFSPVVVMAIVVTIWFVIGLLFQAADLVFEQDWSLLKMSVTHFSVTVIGFTGLGFLAGWLPLNLAALLLFWLIFIAIYAAIYVINYRQMKNSVDNINRNLKS
ncbi:DUF3021 domain-containing protein [Streptococcus rifensis]